MHVTQVALADFRNHELLKLDLSAGATALVAPNGWGKTNIVEAVHFAATLTSHRVASEQPLVRQGRERAIVRILVHRDGRDLRLEVEINAGRPNRARVNATPLPRPRELLGLLRVVTFAPEDLAVVRGDPAERRRFLDELLITTAPRYAGVRADYERVLRQRNALLKSATGSRKPDLASLEVWDSHLAALGAELTRGRRRLVAAAAPHIVDAYAAVAPGSAPMGVRYDPSVADGGTEEAGAIRDAMLRQLAQRRADELARGVSLVGPHRDELFLGIGELPARGYASHGEGWSLALALRLGAFRLARAQAVEPVLLLDDVFAELDDARRDRLAQHVADAEQVLVTAAVAADVPAGLRQRHVSLPELSGTRSS